MATKISFINLKGGVGKTSLIVNIGACLAYMGKRVLIVDFDPQSNSSIWLMRLDRWNQLNRFPDKFILNLLKEEEPDLDNYIIKNVVKDPEGATALEGLDLIPASFRLMDLEHEVENPREEPFYSHFYKQVEKVSSEYDYILFDCPPNFFKAVQCAIFASDHILVPANPDALSIIGFHLLVDKLVKFRQTSQAYRESLGAPVADILGISINAIKPGAKIDVPLARFSAQIERFKTQGKVWKGAEIFEERIRHSVTVGRAVMQGLPMVLLSKREASMSVAEDYIKTTQRILSLTTPETATAE